MTLQTLFWRAHGWLQEQEQFRLAWILSRPTEVQRLHNMSRGPARLEAMKELASAGFGVDPNIDGYGEDPLQVMRSRQLYGIPFVKHPFEGSHPALVFPVKRPYLIETAVDIEYFVDRLVAPTDLNWQFLAGKATPLAGARIGPKIQPHDGQDHLGEHYRGLHDSEGNPGAWLERDGYRYVLKPVPENPSRMVWVASISPNPIEGRLHGLAADVR